MEGDALSLVINIIASSIGLMGTLIFSIAPEDVIIHKKRKIILTLLPLLEGLVVYIISMFFIYFYEGWKDRPIAKFIAANNIWNNFCFLIVFLTVISIVLAIYILLAKSNNYNDKKLMNHYVRLTNQQLEDGEMTIIGGSLDFLGHCPCRDIPDAMKDECKGKYESDKWIFQCFEKKRKDSKCRDCCLNNKQWLQISGLIDRGCNIHIVCKNPKLYQAKEQKMNQLIGYLLKRGKRKDGSNAMDIKFFEKNSDPFIRGRVVEDYAKVKIVCWNFKKEVNQDSFERPLIETDKTRMGEFYIHSFETMLENAEPIIGADRVEQKSEAHAILITQPTEQEKAEKIQSYIDMFDKRE